MEQTLREDILEKGLKVTFVDVSNRYYGDYHRVRVEVRCTLPLRPDFFADPAALERARSLWGEAFTWSRPLEKMGVAGADVPTAAASLIEGFVASAYPYLTQPQFPARLLSRELSTRRPPLRFSAAGHQ
jgi:hypothetical protein